MGFTLHYYPHHIGDFIRDTSRLSDTRCMAYLRLLWAYYDTELPIPNAPKKLAFQIGASVEDVEAILENFFILDGDAYRHTRCDSEIARYHGKKEKASNSAKARWRNAAEVQAQSEGNANASKTDATNDANQEPITNNHSSSLRSEERDADAPTADVPTPATAAPKKGKAEKTVAKKPDDVNDATWADFMALRAAKRATLTETALKGIAREAEKAGFTLDAALQTCCVRGWTGFDATWVASRAASGAKPRFTEPDFKNIDYGKVRPL